MNRVSKSSSSSRTSIQLRFLPEIMKANVEGVAHLMESMKTHGYATHALFRVLAQCLHRSRSVKRFVYMSSAKALLGNPQLDYVYGEVYLPTQTMRLGADSTSRVTGTTKP